MLLVMKNKIKLNILPNKAEIQRGMITREAV